MRGNSLLLFDPLTLDLLSLEISSTQMRMDKYAPKQMETVTITGHERPFIYNNNINPNTAHAESHSKACYLLPVKVVPAMLTQRGLKAQTQTSVLLLGRIGRATLVSRQEFISRPGAGGGRYVKNSFNKGVRDEDQA